MWSLGGDEIRDSLDHGVRCEGELLAGKAQPSCPSGDLFQRFLAAHVEHAGRIRPVGRLRKLRGHLQEQRALPGTRIAAEQYHGACHEAAAQDPVEFAEARRHARVRGGADVGQLGGALFAARIAAGGPTLGWLIGELA